MGKEELINAIKKIPSSGNIYFDNVGLKKVFYNNSLIWAKKNTSVITWDDTITMQINSGHGSYCGYYSYNTTNGPSYNGNRNSNNCSVSGSGYGFRDQNEYVADSSWVHITTTGKIWEGAKKLIISSSRSYSAEGGNTIAVPSEYAYIYSADGTIVASIGNGETDLSSWNDGTYYFKIFRGSGTYGAWSNGSCSCDCTVTIRP